MKKYIMWYRISIKEKGTVGVNDDDENEDIDVETTWLKIQGDWETYYKS